MAVVFFPSRHVAIRSVGELSLSGSLICTIFALQFELQAGRIWIQSGPEDDLKKGNVIMRRYGGILELIFLNGKERRKPWAAIVFKSRSYCVVLSLMVWVDLVLS